MMSLKALVAAVALGTALIAAPATVSAKTVTSHAKVLTTKAHARKLHRRATKHTALHAKTHKHVAVSGKKVAASKTATGWKHHRSI